MLLLCSYGLIFYFYGVYIKGIHSCFTGSSAWYEEGTRPGADSYPVHHLCEAGIRRVFSTGNGVWSLFDVFSMISNLLPSSVRLYPVITKREKKFKPTSAHLVLDILSRATNHLLLGSSLPPLQMAAVDNAVNGNAPALCDSFRTWRFSCPGP